MLLGFFDSRCTQVCPVVAQELIAAEHDLGPRAADVAFVGINVDPQAESVAAVRHFTVVHGLSRYFARENGPTAPSWQLPGLSAPSKTVSLAQFHSHPLVINFWASWCPPCRKEMPALERAARLLSGRVDFVGLDTQDERSAGLAFARRMGVTYPLATDNAQVYASYGVAGLPTTFFVSAGGTIVGRQVGGMTQAGLAGIVREVFGITVSQR